MFTQAWCTARGTVANCRLGRLFRGFLFRVAFRRHAAVSTAAWSLRARRCRLAVFRASLQRSSLNRYHFPLAMCSYELHGRRWEFRYTNRCFIEHFQSRVPPRRSALLFEFFSETRLRINEPAPVSISSPFNLGALAVVLGEKKIANLYYSLFHAAVHCAPDREREKEKKETLNLEASCHTASVPHLNPYRAVASQKWRRRRLTIIIIIVFVPRAQHARGGLAARTDDARRVAANRMMKFGGPMSRSRGLALALIPPCLCVLFARAMRYSSSRARRTRDSRCRVPPCNRYLAHTLWEYTARGGTLTNTNIARRNLLDFTHTISILNYFFFVHFVYFLLPILYNELFH